MAWSMMSARVGPCLFLLALGLRLVGATGPCLDDDEGWFAASALMLASPAELYRLAWDNKPPGTVAFFWAVARLGVGPGGLVVAARLLMTLLLAGAAIIWGGWLARLAAPPPGRPPPGARAGHAAWVLLAMGGASPKLLATTNESLMLVVLTAVAAASRRLAAATGRWRPATWGVAAGLGVAATALLKVTGVAFVLLPWAAAPALFWAPALGLAVGLAAAGLACGPMAMVEASVLYPMRWLAPLRDESFGLVAGPLLSCAIWAAALAPIWWPARAGRRPPRAASPADAHGRAMGRIMAAWGAAAVAAIAAGRGFFLHYFLLAAPPAAWAWVRGGRDPNASPRRLAALVVIAGAGHLAAALPAAGSLWATDVLLWRAAAPRIAALAPPDRPVLMWGGHPMPLLLAGRRGVPFLVTQRFAAPPYADPARAVAARLALARSPPALIVDASARGDNLFVLPIEAAPEPLRRVLAGYRPWADPALPWLRFWLPEGVAAPSEMCPDPPPATPTAAIAEVRGALAGRAWPALWRQRRLLRRRIEASLCAEACRLQPAACQSSNGDKDGAAPRPPPAGDVAWWSALARVLVQRAL